MFHWVSWTAGGRAWNRSSCILTRFLVWDGVRAECTLAGRDDAKDLFIAGLHRILVKTLKMSENEYKTGKGSNRKAKSVIADVIEWREVTKTQNCCSEKSKFIISVVSLQKQKLLMTFNISSQVFIRISITQMSTLPLGIKLPPMQLHASLHPCFFSVVK